MNDEELKELYKQAHIICLPSMNTTEAYGLVLIEGALYGCIPFASNLIGVRECVYQLKGVLFEPGNLIELIKKIRMFSKDKDLYIHFAKKC